MMTDDEALLRAIIENPDDDGARLVYADWLDEHGEYERAEFIRLQCILARLPKRDPRCEELKGRERVLLGAHGKEWLGGVQRFASRWKFRRGFVEDISVPAQVYLDHADFLLKFTPIRGLEIDLTESVIPLPVIEQVPASVARENVLLPIGRRGQRLVVAMANPKDTDTIAKLAFILNRDIEPAPALADQILDAISHYYGLPDFDPVDTRCFLGEDPYELAEPENDRLPIARLVNLILVEAFALQATEIRIEPEGDVLSVRYRIGSDLVSRDTPPRRLLTQIVERIRFLSAAEPGRLRGTLNGTVFDLALRIEETASGPRVVLAI